MANLQETLTAVRPQLKEALATTNDLALPRFVKVIVTSGVGRIKDKKRLDFIAGRLAKITGQKAAIRGAKKSIASFKIRQGEPASLMVTLRGPRMYGFLEKLFSVAIPRIRDFRGFAETSIDEMGNLSLGIKEHTIFPETSDEELKDIFGLNITLVTSAKNRPSALTFFRTIDFPFRTKN